MPHRTPFKNLKLPVPPVSLTGGKALLLVLNVQPELIDRAVGVGAQATERGIDREFDEYYEQVDHMVRNLGDLLQAWRERRLPVAYTRVVEFGPEQAELANTGLFGVIGDTVESGAEAFRDLPAAVQPQPGDGIGLKSSLSPFPCRDFEPSLDASGIEILALTGVGVDGAIDLVAREAADRGFAVVVISDACVDETYEIHDQRMRNLVGGFIRVRPTDQILEMLDHSRL